MSDWQRAIGTIGGLLEAGVCEFVVCGGARNALLLEALARAEEAKEVKVWSHFEERSAAFFALGRTMEVDLPCAVIVTSGTAVAELLPAVIEAYYQGRPLILVTADRPSGFRGSGAPQAIEQVDIFGVYAQRSLEDWDGLSPLHHNIEFSEGVETGPWEVPELGPFRKNSLRPRVAELARWLREPALKGTLVVIGGLDRDEREEVFYFCEALAAPVIAEATSGLREALQHLAWVASEDDRSKAPIQKVLRLGSVPSGRFWRDLELRPEIEVWSISRSGYRGLSRDSQVTKGMLDRILPALGEGMEVGDPCEILKSSEAKAEKFEELLETYPWSEASCIRLLSTYACLGESVFLGNSLPIREWNSFAQWERPVGTVRASRGANGIDGQISTWLGASANEKNAWGIFGDLTALYDLAGLKLFSEVEKSGRVMVIINNSGGEIFSAISRLKNIHPQAAKWMRAETPVSFEGLAALWGISYLKISHPEDMDQLPSAHEGFLLEVVPDKIESRSFSQALDR